MKSEILHLDSHAVHVYYYSVCMFAEAQTLTPLEYNVFVVFH